MGIREKQSSEKRLIDASVMRDDWLENGKNEYVYDTNAVLDSIDSQPTVDAVEVVRCRECKHRGTDYCIFHIKGEPADEELLRKLDNDFCSYGKRKEGAD